MNGKLYKSPNGEHYYLTVNNQIFADVDGHPLKSINQALSLKNCQAIERGYDLDGLFNEVDESIDFSEFCFTSFRLGFQKALEILGDKKFSEEDVMLIAEYVRVASQSTPTVRTKDLVTEYQSLQQTEWDVEIEMDTIPADRAPGGWDRFPKLDADGCLILKRK